MKSVVTDAKGMVQYAIDKVIPRDKSGCPSVPVNDVFALKELCEMAIFPSSTIDLKSIVRGLSDETINRIATQFRSMARDPYIGILSYLFLMEWGFRNGCLDGDWSWQWDNDRDGIMRYATRHGLTLESIAGRSSSLS